MAQTVRAFSPATGTHVFTARNGSGQWWNGSAFENYNASNIATYAIAATSNGGGEYRASISDNAVSYDLRLRVGGSLATTDAVIDYYAAIPINPVNGNVQADVVMVLGSADAASGIYTIGYQQSQHTDGELSYEALLDLGDYYIANNVLPTSGGGGSGGAISILASALDVVSKLNDTDEPRAIYKGRIYTVDYTFPHYTGDVTDGETLTLRVMPLDSYGDAGASSTLALIETTATCTLSGGTLTATFSFTAVQTATLPAGAKGDGATDYRLQVFPAGSKYPLTDRVVEVRRAMGTPA